MKKIVISLCLCLYASAYASSGTELRKSIFVDRPEVLYPVPTDSDVIEVLGNPSKSQLPSRKIRFLVWNIHKGSEKSFALEYLALSYGRDIVMNQEILLDQNMSAVMNSLPHFLFTTATSFFSGKEKIRTGVANISAVKPARTDFIRTEVMEPVVNSPKVALITSYPIGPSDKELTVVNIHGINFVSTKSFHYEMGRLYERIKDLPPPLVFAGDFNTWNKDRTKILGHYIKKLGLLEANFSPDERMTFNDFPLDHFLHSKDLRVTSARVDKFYKGSDHKPLLVELEYLSQE